MAKKRVLIVEDNAELGFIYAAALHADYESEQILDGKSALKRLDEDPLPDLIVLDMNLPLVSGHYLFTKLRTDSRFSRVPIVVVTANNLVADAIKGDITPIDRILIKPISPARLREIVKGLGEVAQD